MLTTYKLMHACIDKPAYPTRGEAIRKLYFCMVRKGVLDPGLHAYECPFSNHWHLGKTKKKESK
jgi:hypothetical protein